MKDQKGARFDLSGVQVSFNQTAALSSVDLTIAQGDSVAFVGASGAGKTTLLRLLNASVRPSSGQVLVNGQDPFSLSFRELRELRRQIGFVHQQYNLLPNLRVAQNVLFGRLGDWSFPKSIKEFLFPSKSNLEEVYELLNRVGISEKLFERTDTLSGGQQQRVAIARALFQNPRVLVADEPVSSVDPARARDTIGLLRELAMSQNLTLCVSLHNFDLACEFFPRLVGLHKGKVLFDSSPADVSPNEREELYRIRQAEMLDHD